MSTAVDRYPTQRLTQPSLGGYVSLFLLSLWSISIYAAQPPTLPSTIKLTNGEWPPYLSEQLPHGGPSSQVIEEVYQLQGIQVQWGWYPWQRSYNLAKSGSYDGTVIWSYNQERAEDFVYTAPTLHERRVLFHLQSQSFDWQQLSDLRQYRFGGTIAYEYSYEFQNLEASGVLTVERTKEEWVNLKRLLNGSIDIFVATERVGLALMEVWLTPAQAANITFDDKPLDEQQWSVLISNNSQHRDYFVEQFNLGLEKLKQSGRYDAIMSQIQ
ncbi:hypothetical protein CHH28_05720 [Bacterioplanes sanyensis]|uniref:Solute-binding protein family 3/N-terminal domain-containing protein n=1 Tax=Bacterioplanes sanyensis TaxID=1249553 RepID=A0A222FHT9_9GAMM|nr:hypothetical protein CHH28_05720 [Bacterioplanes sanyensis]